MSGCGAYGGSGSDASHACTGGSGSGAAAKSVDLFERNAARAPSRGTPACSGSKQQNKFFFVEWF